MDKWKFMHQNKRMEEITGKEFAERIAKNPAWAKTLTQPVAVSTFCNLRDSPISHLSPFLHFSGPNQNGCVAEFSSCKNLKVAQGTFHGSVNFSESGIETIDKEKLRITKPDLGGDAAEFKSCHTLQKAVGTYPGYVSFEYSGIKEIDPEFTVTHQNNLGHCANFDNCPNLKIARGKFAGMVFFSMAGIEEIDPDKLVIFKSSNYGYAASFYGCPKLKIANGTFPGSVSFRQCGIEKIGEKFHITKPNTDGFYADFEQNPIMNQPTGRKTVARNICRGKSMEEINRLHNTIILGTDQPQMENCLTEYRKSLQTALKKNAAVEIQIE